MPRKKLVDELLGILRDLGLNVDAGTKVIRKFDDLVTVCSWIQQITNDKPYTVLKRIISTEDSVERKKLVAMLKKILGKHGYILHSDLEEQLLTLHD